MNVEKLTAIHEQVLKCTMCPLHKTRTQAVPGSGNFKKVSIKSRRSFKDHNGMG